jgi:hypothetical protein
LGKKQFGLTFGIGLGTYRAVVFNTNDFKEVGTSDKRVFGFAPRAGLQISHFRLGVEYNLVQDNNYFSVKIGTSIGGGRK